MKQFTQTYPYSTNNGTFYSSKSPSTSVNSFKETNFSQNSSNYPRFSHTTVFIPQSHQMYREGLKTSPECPQTERTFNCNSSSRREDNGLCSEIEFLRKQNRRLIEENTTLKIENKQLTLKKQNHPVQEDSLRRIRSQENFRNDEWIRCCSDCYEKIFPTEDRIKQNNYGFKTKYV